MDLLPSFIFILTIACSTAIKRYDLRNYCKVPSIPVPTDGDMILYYDSSNGTPITCQVHIDNNMTSNSSILLAHIEYFNTPCGTSRMDIYDSQTDDQNKTLTGKDGICGSYASFSYEKLNYNTTQKFMTINFTGKNSHFRILLTAAYRGHCGHHDFNCGNGFCIPDDLVCNSHNNCQNAMEEVACVLALAAWVIAVIVVCSLVGVICLGAVCFCLICRPRRRRTMYRQI